MKLTKGSLELGAVKAIPIRIHWSFLLIIVYIAYLQISEGGDWMQVLWAIAFVLSLFACVTLHELGHAMAALRYGVRTRGITLYPIGGVAMLERIPEKPLQELAVAIAGPMVNVVIAAILVLILWLSPVEYRLEDLKQSIGSSNFLLQLAAVNIILVLFNLLPAFPMDGGRIFRAFLAMHMDRVKATRFAMYVGQGMAVLFAIWGLQSNPFLILIAAFVFFGAAQEYKMVRSASYIRLHFVGNAMMKNFTRLQVQQSLADVMQIMLNGQEKDFVVFHPNGEPAGIMTRDILIKALTDHGTTISIESFIQPINQSFSTDMPLAEAYKCMQSEGLSIVPIIENNQTIGVINMENILEYIMFAEAMKSE